jgi:UDP-glucuronate decarboxylase
MINRILVTGGAGFLGSHLCDRLVEAGQDVICVDNFFTSQKSNISHLLGKPNFELIRHDVTHPLFLEVDQIYNLACPAAPGHYQYNPIKTTKTSVMGAINMLGLAKRVGAKILHSSTSEVYGDPDIHPQPETYRGNVNPIGPRACYDEGKRAAETLMFDYLRQNRVNIRVVRIFNTYGPRMHPFDGRVVSNFIRQALVGEDISIYGDGGQTRSFCYVDDLVDGILTSRGRSTSATPTSSRFGSSPSRSRSSRARRLRSSSRGTCPRMIRCSGSPTSRWRSAGSAGSRRSLCARGSSARSSGSEAWTCPRSGRRRQTTEDLRGGSARRGIIRRLWLRR